FCSRFIHLTSVYIFIPYIVLENISLGLFPSTPDRDLEKPGGLAFLVAEMPPALRRKRHIIVWMPECGLIASHPVALTFRAASVVPLLGGTSGVELLL
ncbi:unnamed protein product, partial [Gulo gulo]